MEELDFGGLEHLIVHRSIIRSNGNIQKPVHSDDFSRKWKIRLATEVLLCHMIWELFPKQKGFGLESAEPESYSQSTSTESRCPFNHLLALHQAHHYHSSPSYELYIRGHP